MSAALGALRARIRLQRPERVLDDVGGATITWSDQGAAWAAVESEGGGESDVSDGAESEALYSFEIRARPDVRGGWRVQWGERTLRIRYVRDAGEARIFLHCVELAP